VSSLPQSINQSAFGHTGPCDLSLFADWYGLIMMQGNYEKEYIPTATCSVYFRRLLPDRGYTLVTGPEQMIDYVETIEFGEAGDLFSLRPNVRR
jgi:nicotinic acid phosphoribosyltransferase